MLSIFGAFLRLCFANIRVAARCGLTFNSSRTRFAGRLNLGVSIHVTDQRIRKPLTTGAKVFLVAAIVLCVVNFADFTFYGRRATDLIVAAGFALMAYGTYKNGNRSRPDYENDPTFDRNAQYATVAGVILVLGAFVAQYLL